MDEKQVIAQVKSANQKFFNASTVRMFGDQGYKWDFEAKEITVEHIFKGSDGVTQVWYTVYSWDNEDMELRRVRRID